MFKIFILLALAFWSGSAGAANQPTPCAAAVRNGTIDWGAENDYLILPPKSHRFLIASLVKTKNHGPVLALGGYRIPHSSLDKTLGLLQGDEISEFEYVWLGEIRIENETDQKAVGLITFANETSGLFFRELKEKGVSNSVQEFQQIMQPTGLLSPKFQPITWKETEDSGEKHLMKKMRRYVKSFETDARIDDDSYRHYLLNQVARFREYVPILLRANESESERAKTIQEWFQATPLLPESLFIYDKWLRNDGIVRDRNTVDLLKRIRRELKEGAQVSYADWNELTTQFSRHFVSHDSNDEAGSYVNLLLLDDLTRNSASK